jgi:hypothetical protein
MKIHLTLVFLLVTLFSQNEVALAQAGLIPGTNDPSKADIKVLTGEQRLAHIVLTPADKKGELYIVGNKEGEIDLNNLNRFSGQINSGQYAEAGPDSEEENSQNSATAVKSKKPQVRIPPPMQVTLRRRRVPHRQVAIAPPLKRKVVKPQVAARPPVRKLPSFGDFSLVWILLLLFIIAAYAHRVSLRRPKKRSPPIRIFS